MSPAELDALVASWPKCDLWDCSEDAENLEHESALAALDAFFDSSRSGAELAAWVADGWIVYGWTRKIVIDDDIESMIDRLTEAFHEHWNDGLEFGDHDDDDPPPVEWLRAAVTNDMRKRRVYQCEDETIELELTAEQVLAIARLRRPALFSKGPTP